MDKMTGIVLHSAKKAGIQIRISHSHNTSSEGGIAAKNINGMQENLFFHMQPNLFPVLFCC